MPYFVTFTFTNWIDLFMRDVYRDIMIDSIGFCQREKDLIVYAWCIMTSHIHMIIGSKGKLLSDILRDLKRHTSEKLHQSILKNPTESRREWMLNMMTPSGRGFQLWQPESHPIVLDSAKIIEQKLNYIHQNPVDAGFVHEAADWKYSIARDYRGEKGIIEINYLGNEYV